MIESDRRCPYCGSPLDSDNTSRDGEALWCSDCGVEYWDALEAAEESLVIMVEGGDVNE